MKNSIPLLLFICFAVTMVPNDEYGKEDERECSAQCVGNGLSQVESFWGDKYVGAADHAHPQAWDERDPIAFLFLGQPYGDGPEGEDGECLVEPSKIAPQYLKID